MPADRLGPMQRKVLSAMLRYGAEAPPTAWELADRVARTEGLTTRRPTAEAENVSGCLRRMASRGWVERTGSAFNGAWCWRITPTGRTALEETMSGTTTGDDSE